MAEKIQEPMANLRTKDQIKVKVGDDGRNVVEAQSVKEQKTIEAKETGVTSPQAPKVGSDRDVGKEVSEEKIAVSQIGSQPSSFTKPDPNSNETCYCQKELVLGELIMKAKKDGVPFTWAGQQFFPPKSESDPRRSPSDRVYEKDKPVKKARDSFATAASVSQEMGYTAELLVKSSMGERMEQWDKYAAGRPTNKGGAHTTIAQDAAKDAVNEEKCSDVKKSEVLTEMLEKAAGF